jgi:hypothetical protein
MRRRATGLLVAMAALFLASRWSIASPSRPSGFVKAFAEAAMVGGLADWFAVTALFRHPLGLPIPHTAIIPTNKDRIGDTLAQFLRTISSPPPWWRGACGHGCGRRHRALSRQPGRHRADGRLAGWRIAPAGRCAGGAG